MGKTTRVAAATDVPHMRPFIARDLVKLYKAFTHRFPNPQLRPDDVTVEAFRTLFDDCQTEYLHFIGRTSPTQPYVHFMVKEVLALASVYLSLPVLLPTSAPPPADAKAVLTPHVRPFALLLVYLLYATQPLHAPPAHLLDFPSPDVVPAGGPRSAAVLAAQRRRAEVGVAELTVLEYALLAEDDVEGPAATPVGGTAPANGDTGSAGASQPARKPVEDVEAWEMAALDDKDLFPRLYPLPVTVARPVMDSYISAATSSPAAGPVQAPLLPVERFILAAMHHHHAWHIVPVVDIAASLSLMTQAHAELEAPLMVLSTARRPSPHERPVGRARARPSLHELFSSSQRTPTAAETPLTGTGGNLLQNPAFQAQLQAYNAMKEQQRI